MSRRRCTNNNSIWFQGLQQVPEIHMRTMLVLNKIKLKQKGEQHNMKNLKTYTLIIIGLIAFFYVVGRIGYEEDHYTREATVTNVKNEIIYVMDTKGYYWSFESSEFAIGDEVKMLMCANHTGDISDDIIEEVVLR